MADAGDTAFVFIRTVITFMGLFGNGLVLVHLFRHKMGSRLTTFLLRCQCFSDGAVCLINIIINFQPNMWTTGIRGLDEVICQVWHSQGIYWNLVFFSVQNLVAVAFDRFWAVVRAQDYKTNQAKRMFLCFGVCLILTLIFAWPNFLLSKNVNGTCTGTPDWGPGFPEFFYAFALSWFLTAYLLPTIIFFILYGWIIMVLKKQSSQQSSEKSSGSKAATQLTITMIIVTAVFILSMSVDTFYYLLSSTGNLVYVLNSPLQKIALFLVAFNSCANTYIYLITMKSFRRQMLRTLLCKTGAEVEPTEEQTSRVQ